MPKSVISEEARREVGRRLAEARRKKREAAKAAETATSEPVRVASNIHLPAESDWSTIDIEQGYQLISDLQRATEQGAHILQQRSSSREEKLTCMVCGNELPKRHDPARGMTYGWVWREVRYDHEQCRYLANYICSQRCFFSASNAGKLNRGGRAGDAPPSQ